MEKIYEIAKEAWVVSYSVDKGYILHPSEVDALEAIAEAICEANILKFKETS